MVSISRCRYKMERWIVNQHSKCEIIVFKFAIFARVYGEEGEHSVEFLNPKISEGACIEYTVEGGKFYHEITT